MTTYCYRCPSCDLRSEGPAPPEPLICGPCFMQRSDQVKLVRDYRAENVSPAVAELKRTREQGSAEDLKRLVLPTAEYYDHPGDRSEGQDGLREWADTTRPVEGNKKPVRPDIKKKFHAVGGG